MILTPERFNIAANLLSDIHFAQLSQMLLYKIQSRVAPFPSSVSLVSFNPEQLFPLPSSFPWPHFFVFRETDKFEQSRLIVL